MQKIELEFDEQTLERARQLAMHRQISLEEWLKTIVKQLVTVWSSPTLTAWELEKEFIHRRMANSSSTISVERNWTREDIYNARLPG
jgi:hypothetical protein